MLWTAHILRLRFEVLRLPSHHLIIIIVVESAFSFAFSIDLLLPITTSRDTDMLS